jgi:hypothetical protein
MPKIMTAAQVNATIPALRYAARQAGVPAWILVALKAFGRWGPILLKLFLELAPLFATGKYVKPETVLDPLDDPELSIATKATIRHARVMQSTGFDSPFDE